MNPNNSILPLSFLFIMSICLSLSRNAEAKIWIKPFDSIGARASGDITIPGASGDVLRLSSPGTTWRASPDSIKVQEEDGEPLGYPNALKFANGNLTPNSDGSMSVGDQTGAGGGDPILIEGNAVGDAAGVDLLGGAGIDTAFDGGVSPDTGTFTLDLAEAVVGSGILPTTNLQLAQRQFGAISRDGYITGQGITSIDVLVTKSHDAVTVTGEDYLTLLGQEITQGTISDTHLTAEDFGDFTCDSAEDGCTLDTDSVDANELNATGVEAELEAALDIGGEVTSTGMASTVIADSVTVTGWVMGASTATTPSANDNDTSLATSAFVQTELDSHEPRAIGITIDGGGSAITTGVKGFIEVPYACTITRSTTLADQSGSIVIDVWKDTYANYPPTVADTITASAKPTITTATKAQDATLTGWTTTVAAGDILGFNVDSITTIQRVHEILKCDISG